MRKIVEGGSFLGLSDEQAQSLLIKEGYNDLPSSKPRNIFAIAFSVCREPMFILLVACGVIYLLLGDRQDALMLLGFVFVIMSITFFQERKTERALEALRSLSSPRACVIRNGVKKRIPGREVVRGDILILVEGDRIPADAIILQCTSLTVDEALLTGESVSVRKLAAEKLQGLIELPIGTPGGDDLPYVFSGTLVVQGKGIAQVMSIGENTAIGSIGKALSSIKPESTHIKLEIEQVVRRVSWAGFALAGFVAVWYGFTRSDWLSGFLSGITLAMALLPEELPVVLTIFLGLGAWRMAQKKVLTRHVPAIEMLGAATVLCVDKTGTLTQNKMEIAQLCASNQMFEVAQALVLPEAYHAVLEFAVLASHRDPFDPMEIAIRECGLKLLAGTEHLHGAWQLVDDYPLTKELLAMSRVWRSQNSAHYIIAAKGAPEAIIDLCHLDAETAQKIIEQVNILAEKGLRVLAIAKAKFTEQTLPEIQHDFVFGYLGLIALADPIRPNVTASIKEAHNAGIRVVMITGDYPATAMNIARQIGLESLDGVITGLELNILSDEELQIRIKTVNIFCRVVPEQKLRLVNAFKADGEIVAMTGDGVNDAPALKAAHIGIAMGGRGTDVARESASLVLLDDDFSSIVTSVKIGRRIFDNLRKAIAFIVAVHVPIVGLSLIPVMLGWPAVLMPVHILFLQLIIDPVCSIVFEAEPEEADVMQRAPRLSTARLFDSNVLKHGLLQGLLLLVVVLVIYGFTLYQGIGADEARALTFTTLVLSSIGLIFTNRSWTKSALTSLKIPNPALWWISTSAMAILVLILLLPELSRLFSFSQLHGDAIVFCGLMGFLTLLVPEALKWLRTRHNE
ncbi:MAG: cation-translocating P-type ATPase [Methylophilus sp.]|nr:cation-translocating P-type ATPase [Methylophilus sp.]